MTYVGSKVLFRSKYRIEDSDCLWCRPEYSVGFWLVSTREMSLDVFFFRPNFQGVDFDQCEEAGSDRFAGVKQNEKDHNFDTVFLWSRPFRSLGRCYERDSKI